MVNTALVYQTRFQKNLHEAYVDFNEAGLGLQPSP